MFCDMDAEEISALHAQVQRAAPKGHVRAPDGSVLPWPWFDKRLGCPVPGCSFNRATVSAVKAHLLEVHGWSSCGSYVCYCPRCAGAVLFADKAHATAFHGKPYNKEQHLRDFENLK